MYRNKEDALPQQVNCLFSHGGLGDWLARSTVLRYIYDTYPHVSVTLIVPDFFEEVAENILSPYLSRIRIVPYRNRNRVDCKTCFNSYRAEYMTKEKGLQPCPACGETARLVPYVDVTLPALFTNNPYHTNLRTHMVDHAFAAMLDVTQVPPHYKTYLPFHNLPSIAKFSIPPGRYAVMTPMFTAKARQSNVREHNRIKKWLTLKGYNVVYLGKSVQDYDGPTQLLNKTARVDFSNVIDLTNRTNLLEAAAVLKGADVAVGIDNGLLHLAASVDTPVVAGFTSVNPSTRIPYGAEQTFLSVVPDKSLACRFCQTNMNFLYTHDFRDCFYKDFKCIDGMKAWKFVKRLRELI